MCTSAKAPEESCSVPLQSAAVICARAKAKVLSFTCALQVPVRGGQGCRGWHSHSHHPQPEPTPPGPHHGPKWLCPQEGDLPPPPPRKKTHLTPNLSPTPYSLAAKASWPGLFSFPQFVISYHGPNRLGFCQNIIRRDPATSQDLGSHGEGQIASNCIPNWRTYRYKDAFLGMCPVYGTGVFFY